MTRLKAGDTGACDPIEGEPINTACHARVKARARCIIPRS